MQITDTSGHAVLYFALHFNQVYLITPVIWFGKLILEMTINILFATQGMMRVK